MNAQTPSYHGHRLPREIISHAVWLNHRFCLSFRDLEDLLAERGVTASYETIRWHLVGRHLVGRASAALRGTSIRRRPPN